MPRWKPTKRKDRVNLDWNDRFKRAIEEHASVGEEYALAKGRSWEVQELKGAMVAKLMLKHKDLAVSRADIEVKASEEYSQYIIETSKMIELELKLKVRVETCKYKIEAYRSLCSLEKATLKEIG